MIITKITTAIALLAAVVVAGFVATPTPTMAEDDAKPSVGMVDDDHGRWLLLQVDNAPDDAVAIRLVVFTDWHHPLGHAKDRCTYIKTPNRYAHMLSALYGDPAVSVPHRYRWAPHNLRSDEYGWLRMGSGKATLHSPTKQGYRVPGVAVGGMQSMPEWYCHFKFGTSARLELLRDGSGFHHHADGYPHQPTPVEDIIVARDYYDADYSM